MSGGEHIVQMANDIGNFFRAETDRQARRIIRQVRLHFNKKTMQPVTFKEFSQYTGIDIETIYQQLDL